MGEHCTGSIETKILNTETPLSTMPFDLSMGEPLMANSTWYYHADSIIVSIIMKIHKYAKIIMRDKIKSKSVMYLI